ncbi:MFS transporter [Candidatus Lucifugimonas marina]|uniref:MFS transporter n=1 Tax=Candidatus Lucifugimonas marina TaxID=3038979 RepID=A0AAJ5ZI53_9CHLR|nr:MFS transporter [SAR202 cluster bacterium JH702]MDG0868597.1 MFS transporter [SAR202 cluster bacterium JH639]WFG35232.1 MFS transporter [SAR202 cluster bacterium JH545]WFG39182.1 MFS transporter [SAR202 cluster bacterium JH1073]
MTHAPSKSAAASESSCGSDSPSSGNSQTRYIITVALATYFFWISLYLYVPVLPLHAQDLGANLEMVGIIIASYAIGQLLLRIPIGVGSDIVGRKPFAVGALILSALGAMWLALSPDAWSLFAARTLTGVAAAGWVAISVLFASYYPAGNTSRAMAIIMSVNTLSLVTATFIGGIVAEYFGNLSTFYGAAGIGFAGALLLLSAPEPKIVAVKKYSISTLVGILKTPLLLRVSAIAITLQFVTFGVNFGFLPIHAENLGASKSEIGYITTAGLLAAVGGTAVSAWVSKRWGPTTAVMVAGLATLFSLVVMTITTDLMTLGALQAFNGFGRGMMNTVLISMALASAPVAIRATAMGSYQALYAIGMLLGPAASGPIAAAFGIEMVFWAAAASTVVGGAIALIKPLPR